MSVEPINLAAERSKREQPDPQFVKHDDFGRPMFCFAYDYQMGGDTWVGQVWAYDWDNAAQRVAAIRESAVITGQLMGAVRS